MKTTITSKGVSIKIISLLLVLTLIIVIGYFAGERFTMSVSPESIQTGGIMNMKPLIIKFSLWFIFLAVVFFMFRRYTLERKKHLVIYGISFLIFGLLFGPEPSPLHPVKDFIFNAAAGKPAIPFLIFILLFLILSIIINRSICSWGCQFGVLQDFVHRIFRNNKDTGSIVRAYKPSFKLTNTIRNISFLVLIVSSLLFSYDIFANIDPFQIFRPATLGIGSAVFAGIIIVGSIFIYRPFCYFFCPFGFISWMASKINLIRIRVDREKCTDCKACIRACPSNAMADIYNGKTLGQDCYSCGSCINACPVHAVALRGKQENE